MGDAIQKFNQVFSGEKKGCFFKVFKNQTFKMFLGIIAVYMYLEKSGFSSRPI